MTRNTWEDWTVQLMRTYVWEKITFLHIKWTSYWFAFDIKQTTSLFYLEVNRRRFRGRDISRKKVNGDNFITPIVATFYPYVKVISNGFLTAQNKFRIRSFHMHYTPCFLLTLYWKKKERKTDLHFSLATGKISKKKNTLLSFKTLLVDFKA